MIKGLTKLLLETMSNKTQDLAERAERLQEAIASLKEQMGVVKTCWLLVEIDAVTR